LTLTIKSPHQRIGRVHLDIRGHDLNRLGPSVHAYLLNKCPLRYTWTLNSPLIMTALPRLLVNVESPDAYRPHDSDSASGHLHFVIMSKIKGRPSLSPSAVTLRGPSLAM
jgi:hypothetical protein